MHREASILHSDASQVHLFSLEFKPNTAKALRFVDRDRVHKLFLEVSWARCLIDPFRVNLNAFKAINDSRENPRPMLFSIKHLQSLTTLPRGHDYF